MEEQGKIVLSIFGFTIVITFPSSEPVVPENDELSPGSEVAPALEAVRAN